MDKRKKFIIIDGNAILHRAWHALPPLTTKKGEMVNAVYGFALIFLKVLKEYRPDYLAVTFDRKAPTFRHEMYKEYKAGRVKQPDELYNQLPRLKEMIAAFNVPIFEKDGYEADDLIGTLAEQSTETEDIILTGDLDVLQLIDENTSVYALQKGITNIVAYDQKAVEERYGLKPEQLIDYKALAGDPSDNIHGVKGIGPKGAADLIREFGSLEGIYRHLEECEQGKKECRVKERNKKLLLEQKESAWLGKKLVTIMRDAPIDFQLEDCLMRGLNREKLLKLFQELEFKSLMGKISDLIEERKLTVAEPSVVRLPGDKGAKNEQYHFSDGRQKDDITVKRIKTEKELENFLEELEQQEFVAIGVSEEDENASVNLCWNEKEIYHISDKAIKRSRDQFKRLKQIIENSAVRKCGHDLKRDIKILNKAGIDLRGAAFDTMLAAYLLNPGKREYELSDVVFEELGEETKISSDSPPAVGYIRRLTETMWPKIEKEGMTTLLEKIEMPLVPVLAEMEIAGVKINVEFLRQLSRKMEKEIKSLEINIYKLAGEEFNINSPKQLKVILFEKLGISSSGVKKTKTGLSTAAPELEKLRPKHKIIDFIFQHRELAKLKSTYADALPNLVSPATGRVHTSFNQAITSTGRLSSSSPNLQNIPIRTELGREIRKAFIAEKGFKLLSADYSQIELRIVASLANDRKMLESFDNKEDIHTRTAAEVFGCELSEVTREMRRAAKVVNFGVIYGMSVYGLSQSAGLAVEEAQDFIDKYFQVYGGIAEYVEQMKAMAHSLGYVETLFGRRRYLPEINSGVMGVRMAAERMAVNMPVQGTAADLMKLAMIEVHTRINREFGPENSGLANQPRIKKPLVSMLMQVHDELIFEVKEDKLKEAAALIKETMENPTPLFKSKAPIEVIIKVGDNWEEIETYNT